MTQDFLGTRRDVPTPVATVSDTVATTNEQGATPSVDGDAAATPPRRRFTMTVEDVASRLHQYGFDRDARTIQRWCKSGKLGAVYDHSDGGRWIVDPGTVQPVIDDILKQTSRQPTPFSQTSRQETQHVVDTTTVPRQGDDTADSSFVHNSDRQPDVAATPSDSQTTSPYVATTSADHDDIVATLKKQVADLESKLTLQETTAKADKMVRDKMIEYQREEFRKWIDDGMDKAEQIGSLKAEVRQLREQLPPPIQTPLLPTDDPVQKPQSTFLGSNEVSNLESYEHGYPQEENPSSAV